ncbi:MAG TPA: J domain-containing protein [Myxococcota bacterium]|nr:J domain-containing protein [Myxococcota bacterium]
MTALDPAEIRALDAILEELDYYQVLELVPGAPTSAIRSAYHQASRRFHPDGHRARHPELQPPLARISKRVAEAYSVLRDPRRRQVYDRQLAADRNTLRMPLVQAEAEADRQRREAREGRTPNGRRYFALAQRDLASGNHVAAERNLRTALTFEPDNALFRETLAQLKKR